MTGPDSPNESLPPLYAKWMAELLEGPIPRESRATCDNCAMCAPEEGQEGPQSDYYDPTIKCCTYVPDLHNFLVGRILSDNDPATEWGRGTVEERIKAGVAVTPLGLGLPPVFSLLYENSESAFGSSRTLRCPHLEDGGRCGIWRNRESTCATWFCKHVRGSIGYVFWRESLHRLLTTIEHDLSRWCLLQLDLGQQALRHLIESPTWCGHSERVTGKSLDNRVDRDAYIQVWGKWLGREHEFFINCANLVNPLTWAEALSICGPEVRAHATLTEDAYGRLMSYEIPSTLRAGEMQLVRITHDLTRVSTYVSSDPIDVPNVVMESLHYFDGRPTEEVVAAIALERGVEIDFSLVRKMADFELLVAPKESV